jgi:hypothetical protein
MNSYDHWKSTEPEEQKRTRTIHCPKCNEAVEADLSVPTYLEYPRCRHLILTND